MNRNNENCPSKTVVTSEIVSFLYSQHHQLSFLALNRQEKHKSHLHQADLLLISQGMFAGREHDWVFLNN